MSKRIFYGVKVGRNPGVYLGWAALNAQVNDYKGAEWKIFTTHKDAQEFCFPDGVPTKPEMSASIFYGVKVGKNPGVYFGWADCNAQVHGVQGAVWKKFSSFEDAQEFCFPNGIPIKSGGFNSSQSSEGSGNLDTAVNTTAIYVGTKANPINIDDLDDTPTSSHPPDVKISDNKHNNIKHPYEKSPDHKYNPSRYLPNAMENPFNGKTYTKMRAMLGLSSTLCTDSDSVDDSRDEEVVSSSTDRSEPVLPPINTNQTVEYHNISTDRETVTLPKLDFVNLTNDDGESDRPNTKRKRRLSKRLKVKSEKATTSQNENVEQDKTYNDDFSSASEDEIKFIPNPKKEIQLNQSQSEDYHRVGSSDQEIAVGVFWDIENVRMPRGMNPALLITKIREKFIDVSPLFSEKHFYVVCDVSDERHDVMKQLFEFHVRIIHVPRLKANSSDNVLRDLMNEFVNYNKYSRIILISGDSDFSHDIHSYRRNKKCDCVLIHDINAKQSLIKSANSAIDYKVLLKDEIAEHEKNNGNNPTDPKRFRYNSRYSQQNHHQQPGKGKGKNAKGAPHGPPAYRYWNRADPKADNSGNTEDGNVTITNSNQAGPSSAAAAGPILIDSILDTSLPDFLSLNTGYNNIATIPAQAAMYNYTPNTSDQLKQAYYRSKKKQMLTPRTQLRRQGGKAAARKGHIKRKDKKRHRSAKKLWKIQKC